MEKVTFKQIFENIYKFEWNPSLTHLPGWWNIIYNSINAKGNLDPEDPVIQPWLSFSKVMSKVITYWQKKSKKLDGHSLTTLLEKLSTIPGDILATSFSSEDAESLTNLWKSYAYMEDPEETECLDSVSNPTTSTSSTTVLTVDEIADALSKKKLNLLESLDQIVNTTSQSINLPEQTGTMSSSISFLQNGELATYGLEEKVGKYRLTVSKKYHSYIHFLMALFTYRSTGTMGRNL